MRLARMCVKSRYSPSHTGPSVSGTADGFISNSNFQLTEFPSNGVRQELRGCGDARRTRYFARDRVHRALEVLFIVEKAHREPQRAVLDVGYDPVMLAQALHECGGVRD